ncbi:hypothetical protein J4232_02660 [Candidatus Woesearchaeota archaeon]|nr:hypothetical protein [Candidatus Woesearchaeota archaeon]
MITIIKQTRIVREALKEVYSSKKYFFISFVVALAFFLFNVFINNYSIIFSNFSFLLFFSLLKGAIFTMTAYSFIFYILTLFLASIVAAMVIFLVRRQVNGTLGMSSSGIIVSLIAPSCSSCAIGILSMLGVGGFLAILPFKGAELWFFGVGLLGVSTVSLSNRIITKTCSIPPKEVKIYGNNKM